MEVNKILQGNCQEVLKTLPENSVDAVVTDPPYEIGFVGKAWDSTGIAYSVEMWKECLRVLKPGGHLLAFSSCYDDKTEVLTENGWKFFKDCNKLDKFITLNIETQVIEYQYSLNIVCYNGCKKMYHFLSNKIDLMVTPNHKVLVNYLGGYKNSKWKLVDANKTKSAIKMKKNGIWKGEKQDFFVLPSIMQSNGHYINKIEEKRIPMNIWLKFFGLWIAEGSSTITNMKTGKGYNVQICHFNNTNLDVLEKELGPYFKICRYKKSGKFRINNKQLAEYLRPFCYSWNKYIPTEIKNLCSEQLQILLKWYMNGDSDGHRCFTCSKKLVDDLQEIALKIGMSADYVICKDKNSVINKRQIIQRHTLYAVSINFKQNEPEIYNRRRKTNVRSVVNYNGLVYCAELPKYHTLYVRRNGKTVWSGNSRTYHRMACAIEDAGFEIRGQLMWLYGAGFPKSLNIAKAIDNQDGFEGKVVGKADGAGTPGTLFSWRAGQYVRELSEKAKKFEGWGTALKPGHEPIAFARKPISESTVADNMIKWGVGAINIDECRIPREEGDTSGWSQAPGKASGFSPGNPEGMDYSKPRPQKPDNKDGRWPADVIHDGSSEVTDMFPKTEKGSASDYDTEEAENQDNVVRFKGTNWKSGRHYGDGGSAARFFYSAKASNKERNMNLEGMEKTARIRQGLPFSTLSENSHPTVKPIALMRYLVKLVTPKSGLVMDIFLGSGSTAVAAKLDGFNFLGIEREWEYVGIAEKRIGLAESERPREEIIHQKVKAYARQTGLF